MGWHGFDRAGGDMAITLARFTFLSILLGVLFDLLFGDPRFLPHPVRAIGWLIAVLEKGFRRAFPATPRGEAAGGACLVLLVCLLSAGIPAGLLALGFWLNPYVYLALSALFCWQTLAARDLQKESCKVYRALRAGDIEGARAAVSMIVGRDTSVLDESGIARAAVETVAENTSDGVIAPLFFLFIGGAVGGLFYKAVNTMDSMIGYRENGYLYFGKVAARTDDVCNYIPARLSAWFMLAASALLGMRPRNAWKIYRRDRRKHASPNSAQTESVCAGALGLRLAGDAIYHGVLHPKPWIGDALRQIQPADIVRACRLMYMTAFLALAVFSAIAAPVLWLVF